LPRDFWDEERATRTGLIEKLADFDDALLEQLLEGVEPPKEEIYRHLTRALRGAQIVPVFLGSGLADWGIRRLWKALHHEAPPPRETAERLGIAAKGEPLALDQKQIGIISARLLVPPGALSSFTKVVVPPFIRNLIDALRAAQMDPSGQVLPAGFEGPKFWWPRARTRAFRV
jgi:hypothetical protein